MSPKLLTAYQVASNVATLQLSDTRGLRNLFPINIEGTGVTGLDGPNTIGSVDHDLAQITIGWETADVALTDTLGQVAVPVSWIVEDDVTVFLGFTPTDDDAVWLTDCTSSANQWCYDRRQQAGFLDLPQLVPNGRVFQGTVLRAAMLYRERGSIDSFQTWDSMQQTGGPTGSIGQVLSLLGVGRAAIG